MQTSYLDMGNRCRMRCWDYKKQCRTRCWDYKKRCKGGFAGLESGCEGRVGVVHSWCDRWARDIPNLVSKVALSMNSLKLPKLAGSDSHRTKHVMGREPWFCVCGLWCRSGFCTREMWCKIQFPNTKWVLRMLNLVVAWGKRM